MSSLRIEFTRVSIGRPLSFTFWLAVFAVAIDDDRQKHAKERRRKRQEFVRRHRRPAAGSAPRAF